MQAIGLSVEQITSLSNALAGWWNLFGLNVYAVNTSEERWEFKGEGVRGLGLYIYRDGQPWQTFEIRRARREEPAVAVWVCSS